METAGMMLEAMLRREMAKQGSKRQHARSESQSLAKIRAGPTNATNYHMRLFVAGNEPNSAVAQDSLNRICSTYLNSRCQVEIIDVLEDFRPALQERVLVTPALVILEPGPRTVIFGNLADTGKVLTALKVVV
jgi:circadian clock protein KaiB